MFHRQPAARSTGEVEHDQVPGIDQNRLRATLRFMFDDATADRIALEAASASDETTIKRVVHLAGWEWWSAKLFSRFQRHKPEEKIGPLGPRSGTSRCGALTLALQLGLGLPLDTLAQAFATGADQLGHDLYQTRLKLDPSIKPPCAEFTSAIGRYRDNSLDITKRATLFQHVQRCPACRAALNRFEALDARLINQIEQESANLTTLGEQNALGRFNWLRQPLAIASISLVVVSALIIGGYAIVSNRGNNAASVGSDASLSGWLLHADVAGNIEALNLTTGQNRPLDADTQPARLGFAPSSTSVSPNGKLIANQVASVSRDPSQSPATYLIIETTTGRVLKQIKIDDVYSRFAGWLGNDEVLEISYPPQEPGESSTDYYTRAQAQSELSGIDITTGAKTVLFTGAVINAYPSPDASMIVIMSVVNTTGIGPYNLELCPVNAGRIGSPIDYFSSQPVPGQPTTFDGRFSGSVVWAPDSSRFFTSMNNAPMIAATPNPSATPDFSIQEDFDLVSIARDGKITRVPDPQDGAAHYPFAISPDGRRLIVASEEMTDINTSTNRLSALTLSTGSTVALTGWMPYAFNSGVWSPDGSTMLTTEWRSFLLKTADSTESSDFDPQVFNVIALPPKGTSFIALSRFTDDFGSDLVAWLPEDAIAPVVPDSMPVRLSEPSPVKLAQANLSIEPSAQVSDNHDFVILHDAADNKPVIWDRAKSDGRDLQPGISDLSWLPNTSAVICVANAQFGQLNTPSRLAMFAPTFQTSMPGYDYRTFDPADIGTSKDKGYAAPLMSPNENALAFFVINTTSRSVALWIAQYNTAAKPVEFWTLPNDNKLSYGPRAGWIDNQTLLFTEPGDWQNGMPGSVEINELTVHQDGSTTIATAVTLRRHGTEAGIQVVELAVNQPGGRIAYRVRHFSKAAIDASGTDTIAIAAANKLSDALEVARGGSASGLSWSPDGRILVASTRGALQFYSASGDALFGVAMPASVFANNPRWIDQSDVWFNESNAQGDTIMTVQVQ